MPAVGGLGTPLDGAEVPSVEGSSPAYFSQPGLKVCFLCRPAQARHFSGATGESPVLLLAAFAEAVASNER